MIGLFAVALFVFTAPTALAAITVDYSCTTWSNGFVYDSSATACSNSDDGFCNSMYQPAPGDVLPRSGGNAQRPILCFSSDGGQSQDQGVIDNAVAFCPKNCGMCCRTPGCGGRYPADSSTSCRAWANNGFCTNTFYTTAQKRSYCATTCRIC